MRRSGKRVWVSSATLLYRAMKGSVRAGDMKFLSQRPAAKTESEAQARS